MTAAAAAPSSSPWQFWQYFLDHRGQDLGWLWDHTWLSVLPVVVGLVIALPLGWLARRSRVERELLPELARHLRLRMQERWGISPSLPEEEAARQLERACGLSAADYLAAREELIRALEQRAPRPADYARLARRYAELEARL